VALVTEAGRERDFGKRKVSAPQHRACPFDARAPGITQPGRYTAQLILAQDSPYLVTPVQVTMIVRQSTWLPAVRRP
jgi:hypothetical protein